jgi:hypothetical protein
MLGLSAGLRRIDSFDERTSSPTGLVQPGFFIFSKFSADSVELEEIRHGKYANHFYVSIVPGGLGTGGQRRR